MSSCRAFRRRRKRRPRRAEQQQQQQQQQKASQWPESRNSPRIRPLMATPAR